MAEPDYYAPLRFAEAGRLAGNDEADRNTLMGAGNLLASGDTTGGANALMRGGMLDQGFQVQKQQQQVESQKREQAAAKLETLGKVFSGLKRIPDDGTQAARRQALAGYAPHLRQLGFSDEEIAEMQDDDLSDNNLLMAETQAANAKWQIMQRRDGSVVGVNQGSLQTQEVLPALPAATMQRNTPFGWDVDENGNPYPMDSFVKGKARLAGATRAPARGRSGGGSHPGFGGLPPGYRPK